MPWSCESLSEDMICVCPHPGVWGTVAFSQDGDIEHPWPEGTKTKVLCS